MLFSGISPIPNIKKDCQLLSLAIILIKEVPGHFSCTSPCVSNAARVVAMTKYYVNDATVKKANDGVQLFGGYGYTKDFLSGNNIVMRSILRQGRVRVRYRSW
jgi:alkylation response protein AidB-like acyl-CoA dehydrogenase